MRVGFVEGRLRWLARQGRHQEKGLWSASCVCGSLCGRVKEKETQKREDGGRADYSGGETSSVALPAPALGMDCCTT